MPAIVPELESPTPPDLEVGSFEFELAGLILLESDAASLISSRIIFLEYANIHMNVH